MIFLNNSAYTVTSYKSVTSSKNDESLKPSSLQIEHLKKIIHKEYGELDFEIGKFEKNRIKFYENGVKRVVVLDGKNKKEINKIIKTNQRIILTKDLFAKKILETTQALNTPTYYLYSSGGGGHKSAKDGRIEKDWQEVFETVKNLYKNEFPEIREPRLDNFQSFLLFCKEMDFLNENDVLNDFLGKVGKKSSQSWDKAQESGNVKMQERLASKQWLSDVVFGTPVFFATLKHLMKYKPKKVVSTQALCTPAILFAIQTYNSFYKQTDVEDTKLHLYVTDMPTNYSRHFFNSIKHMTNKGGRKKIILYAPKPATDVDWKVLCGLGNSQVHELKIDELPVRIAFLKAAENFQTYRDNNKIEIFLSCEGEVYLLKQVLKHQNIQMPEVQFIDLEKSQTIDYHIQASDQGYFIMLGSKPTKEAIKRYVDKFVSLAKENPQKKIHLFAYSGKFDLPKPNSDAQASSGKCFYVELCEYIQNIGEWPENLAVVPLSFQNPNQLISLMLNCHTITRSGGATIMELMIIEALRQKLDFTRKTRYVHTQFMKGRKNLVDRLVKWEKGNFFFLRDLLKAGNVSATEPTVFNLASSPL